MGGQRETTVKPASAVGQRLGGTGVADIGDIRIHENAGEVHFHLDKANLKVAVPVAKAFKGWEEVSATPGEWSYIDVEHGTTVTLRSFITAGVMNIDVLVSDTGHQFSDTFKKLNKFFGG